MGMGGSYDRQAQSWRGPNSFPPTIHMGHQHSQQQLLPPPFVPPPQHTMYRPRSPPSHGGGFLHAPPAPQNRSYQQQYPPRYNPAHNGAPLPPPRPVGFSFMHEMRSQVLQAPHSQAPRQMQVPQRDPRLQPRMMAPAHAQHQGYPPFEQSYSGGYPNQQGHFMQQPSMHNHQHFPMQQQMQHHSQYQPAPSMYYQQPQFQSTSSQRPSDPRKRDTRRPN